MVKKTKGRFKLLAQVPPSPVEDGAAAAPAAPDSVPGGDSKETIAGPPHHSTSTPNLSQQAVATMSVPPLHPVIVHSNSFPGTSENPPQAGGAVVPAASPLTTSNEASGSGVAPATAAAVNNVPNAASATSSWSSATTATSPAALAQQAASAANPAALAQQAVVAGQQDTTHSAPPGLAAAIAQSGPQAASPNNDNNSNQKAKKGANRGIQRSQSAASAPQPKAKQVRKGRFVVTTVQDPMTPLAILVPTSPSVAAQGASGQVYNPTAVVVTSGVVPQQVMYTTAAPPPPQTQQAAPPMLEKPPVNRTGNFGQQTAQPNTIATEGVATPLEVNRERPRASSELRPRNPAPPRTTTASNKLNGEKGLGRIFYLVDQMKQEVTDADRTIKSLQSDMKFMVRCVVVDLAYESNDMIFFCRVLTLSCENRTTYTARQE